MHVRTAYFAVGLLQRYQDREMPSSVQDPKEEKIVYYITGIFEKLKLYCQRVNVLVADPL